MRLVKMQDNNLPAICSGDITYLFEDDAILKELEDQEPTILESDIENICERYFEMDELDRIVSNGFNFKSEMKIKDIKVKFIWVNIENKIHRAYQMSGQVFAKSIFTNQWQTMKVAYGNQVFRIDGNHFESQCYHICDSHVDDAKADMEEFDAREYHYKEFLEDILGDAG